MKTCVLVTLVAAVTVVTFAADGPSSLVVHEWGTFTSVQGGDGALLPWQSFQIGELPKFVYDWTKPGLDRQSPLGLMLGKGGVRSLQRMETPVIYFYSDAEFTADVTVHFPQGLITEWYPQATDISAARRDDGLKDSLIQWRDVRVLPPSANQGASQLLATNDSGNHYFSARETDAALLRVNNLSPTNAADEHEKFLFYRGAGSFTTPLKVTVGEDGMLTVENSGDKPLAHLFLLRVHDGWGSWAHIETLQAKESHPWMQLDSFVASPALAPDQLLSQIGEALSAALQTQGLFTREAQAMVKTWSKSWFAEDGVRVLYILPRQWTDATLPMDLNPQPGELVRVMVGRAELITPEMEIDLAAQMKLANSGDASAKDRVQAIAKRFGRFYSPAYQLANKRLASEPNKPVAAQTRN